jgi:hypothetical protein
MLRSAGIVSGFARGSEKGFSGFIVVVVVVDGVGEGGKKRAICLGLTKVGLYYQLKKSWGKTPKIHKQYALSLLLLLICFQKKSQGTHPRCMIFTAILTLSTLVLAVRSVADIFIGLAWHTIVMSRARKQIRSLHVTCKSSR